MNQSIVKEVVKLSTPLKEFVDAGPLIEKVKDKKIVMLGESSHGTQEFYEWRRLISNELIQNHDFNFIAVEGDWPACQGINKFIQGKISEDSVKVLNGFSRWPTWMWGNTEVMSLMYDLREWNKKTGNPAGFHGLDVYSLFESLDEVLKKLNALDSGLALKVRDLYSCLEPYRHDERAYARSLFTMPEGCENEVVMALEELLRVHLEDNDEYFDLVQNARIIHNAEKYYHTMISQDDDSWNVRDMHMMETLDNLLNHYGPESKAIVWAHNTHIGDYRATDMLMHEQVNIGGLAREKYGQENTAHIGFSTYKGQVVASHAWDGPIEVMDVPEGQASSLEAAFHETISKVGHENFYVDFTAVGKDSALNEYLGHRAIGVVYHPGHEGRGNYVPTMPAQRYDGMIFCDTTHALTPLNVRFKKEDIPETYPFGSRI